MKTALICLFIKFCRCLLLIKADHVHTTLVDPDLQIKRGGGGGGREVIQTLRKGGGPGLKFFSRPFGPQFGPQIKAGEGRGEEG